MFDFGVERERGCLECNHLKYRELMLTIYHVIDWFTKIKNSNHYGKLTVNDDFHKLTTSFFGLK